MSNNNTCNELTTNDIMAITFNLIGLLGIITSIKDIKYCFKEINEYICDIYNSKKYCKKWFNTTNFKTMFDNISPGTDFSIIYKKNKKTYLKDDIYKYIYNNDIYVYNYFNEFIIDSSINDDEKTKIKNKLCIRYGKNTNIHEIFMHKIKVWHRKNRLEGFGQNYDIYLYENYIIIELKNKYFKQL